MYADVLVPLPLEGRFTYLLPDALVQQVCVGSRVVVPFGARRHYTAIVARLHDEAPAPGVRMKEVLSVSDPEPIILPSQFSLWSWTADYYLCSEGEVMRAALPSGFNIESDTLREHYRPRTELIVTLTDAYQGPDNEASLSALCDSLARAPKQQELLLHYLEYAGYEDGVCSNVVTRHQLLERSGLSAALLNALVAKGILALVTIEVSRLAGDKLNVCPPVTLSPAQEQCRQDILEGWKRRDVCLLHGVTSCGKTEIYIHLIDEAIRRGEQALFLMPEIALTAQMENRLRRVFGGRLGVYHSRFSDDERVEIWRKQLSDNPYDIILGARSAVFLPFRRLGLVIVDEEHEHTYKQQDPAPRYHARNVAVVLASQFGAKTLLGTATPAVETYHNALTGKYALATLGERYRAVQMPVIQVVDVREEQRRRRMHGSFSPQLLMALREALGRGEQAILFLNRRGYAPVVECRTCGWTPRCECCDVSLTWHRRLDRLVCHYCGRQFLRPSVCPQCGSTELTPLGMGTERIEDELRTLLPDARLDRLDMDTTRARTSFDRILSDFAHGDTDILIGTQMVAKGLDFERVGVVGIMSADSMLNLPDFRSYEHAYQLMAQVAGRAGRRDRQGLVILQTRSADVPLISQLRRYDYPAMYSDEVEQRRMFHYPPFCRLIFVCLRGRDEGRVEHAAFDMKSRLDALFGSERVLGPEAPAVSRVRGLSMRKIMLRLETGFSSSQARMMLRRLVTDMSDAGQLSSILVHFDADPL